MSSKSNNSQSTIISEIRKVEEALKSELKQTEKVLRAELKRGDRVLRDEILKVEENLEKVEEKLIKKMDEQHDEVMTNVSNFAGRVETLETENEIGADQIHRLREDVKNHEKRIAKLESTN